MPTIYPPMFNTMQEIVRSAAKPVIRDYGEMQYLQTIEPNKKIIFQNKTLRNCGDVLYDKISAAYPDARLVFYDKNFRNSSGNNPGDIINKKTEGMVVWISIIDGMENFSRGLSDFSISIAFQEMGEIRFEIIYAPILQEIYWSKASEGAWSDQRRLRMTDRGLSSNSIVSILNGLDLDPKLLTRITHKTKNISHASSFGLSMARVSSSAWDCLLIPKNQEYTTPIIGSLMVKEARGLVSDLDNSLAIASNRAIFEDIKSMLS